MSILDKLIVDIELHSVGGIKKCFSRGVSPNDKFRDKPLIYELISEYTRSPKFKDCVRVFVDYGLEFDDKLFLSVLLDDAETLNLLLRNEPEAVSRKYTLRSAYTPLYQATLLHVCAEFNHVKSAEVLVHYGADINSKAGYDEHGFGGQTPIFHTVNQNCNQSADMLQYLLSKDADLQIGVRGLIWGKSYEWETLIPAVNPISYAMMGLLPQVHRDERTISKTVTMLLEKAFGISYSPNNVPNKYLNS